MPTDLRPPQPRPQQHARRVQRARREDDGAARGDLKTRAAVRCTEDSGRARGAARGALDDHPVHVDGVAVRKYLNQHVIT